MAGPENAEKSDDTDLDRDLAASINEALLKRIDELRPSTRLVYDQIRHAFPDDVREALEARRPVLIVLRLPDGNWAKAAHDAVEASLAALCGTRCGVTVMSSASIPRYSRHCRLDADQVIGDLYEESVCCLMAAEDELPDVLRSFVDLDLTIAPTSGPGLEAVLRRRFPDETQTWPAEIDPGKLRPAPIDLVFRKAGDANNAVRLLSALATAGTSAAPRPVDEAAPRLEDLHGYGEAKAWGLQLAADLVAYEQGRLQWPDVDSGCLLVGPPGTGKTLFASALARSAGCTFLPTSYSDWQSSRSGHLGDLLKRMRQIFTDAAAKAPAIVFIDEIDTLPARGTNDRNDDWWRSVTNALLECLDGTGRRQGVVILAACNDGSNLDPALIRSGRLDRRFRIELPDEAELAEIFQRHLGSDLPLDAIGSVSTALAGLTSGADVVRIAREARRLARTAGRALTADDLLSAALPPEIGTPALRRRVAIHEAGHAVVRMALGSVPLSLSLIRTETTGGGVVMDFDADGVEGTIGDLDRMIMPVLAGRAAEEIILGSASAGAGGSDTSDLARATSWLTHAEARTGLGSRLSFIQEVEGDRIEIRMRRLYAETLLLVTVHRKAIVALADLALEKRVLGRAVLTDFARSHGLAD